MRFEDVNYSLRETGKKIGRLFKKEPSDAVSPLLARIFSTSIINRLDDPEDTGPHYYPGDPGRQYFLNSLGYRSPEFGDADLLVAGCSHSYGVGIDSEYRWGDVLAQRLGLSADNISIPGYSIIDLVETIFTYINTYGAPKHIACLFPDLYRAPYIMVEGTTRSQKEGHRLPMVSNQDQSIWLETTHHIDASPPSISKKPHVVEEIIPPEHYLYENIKAIKSLETLCDAANINLTWGTWDMDFSLVLKYLGHYGYTFKSYVDVEAMKWKRDIAIGDVYTPSNNSCHVSDYEWFNHGSDNEYGIDHAHFGAHRHLHYAEKFLDKIKNAT